MEENERKEAQEKAIKAHAKAIQARKDAEIKAGFLNPFGEETTYEEFLKVVGKSTVSDYCKGKITKEEIEWLENELKILKK